MKSFDLGVRLSIMGCAMGKGKSRVKGKMSLGKMTGQPAIGCFRVQHARARMSRRVLRKDRWLMTNRDEEPKGPIQSP